jgi:hypothetical protein
MCQYSSFHTYIDCHVTKSKLQAEAVTTRRNGKDKSYGNVWNVILAYEALLGKLENLKQQMTEFPDFEYFKIGINQA